MITTGGFSLLYPSIKGEFLCNINVDDDFCDIKWLFVLSRDVW